MTRRAFLLTASGAAATGRPAALIVPVLHLADERTIRGPEKRRFQSQIWREAVRDFGWCGIRLHSTWKVGEVGRSPSGQPVFDGLEHGVINMVLTTHLPMEWDKGRALTGVTTAYEGYDLCMIALNHAHGHRVPFLAVNTCVHELLHVLLDDVLERRPKGLRGDARELRIDWYATRLWLFREGAAIRRAAAAYLERAKGGRRLQDAMTPPAE